MAAGAPWQHHRRQGRNGVALPWIYAAVSGTGMTRTATDVRWAPARDRARPHSFFPLVTRMLGQGHPQTTVGGGGG